MLDTIREFADKIRNMPAVVGHPATLTDRIRAAVYEQGYRIIENEYCPKGSLFLLSGEVFGRMSSTVSHV